MSPSNQQASVRLTGVSALLHFLVDGLCICCLYLATVGKMDIVTTYVTYNVLAFLTQPLTGWWADWMRQRHWMLLGSVLLLTFGVAACQLSTINEQFIMPTAVLLGIGNSLFHVWGGKQVAVNTGNDIRALGVFVSTGAFGLAVGGVLASWSLLYVFLLSICILAIQTLQAQTLPSPSLQGGSSISINEKTSEQGNHPLPVGRVRGGSVVRGGSIILLIMLIVAGRSFTGEAFTTGITKNAMLILLLGATSMAGKMAGGWLAKSMGIWKALLLMVVGTILCFLGKDLYIAVMLTGLFLINCTMPVTLYWANTLLKGYEGLAFGLLAAALIPGYLLAT